MEALRKSALDANAHWLGKISETVDPLKHELRETKRELEEMRKRMVSAEWLLRLCSVGTIGIEVREMLGAHFARFGGGNG